MKAAYYRAPWRSRRKAAQDGVDIEHLIMFAPSLDDAYLQENGEKLGVWETVAEIIAEVGARPMS